MVDAEGELDQGVFRAGADDTAVRPGPQGHVDGADDDGLTCSGLAGQDVEAVREIDFLLFDKSQVFYMKAQKHFYLRKILKILIIIKILKMLLKRFTGAGHV